MITNDAGIIKLKHQIMEDMCRLAWNDQLDEEHFDELAYKISPGPRPNYRCCVYKEREITRQRIRLNMGLKASPDTDNDNIIQVVKPACEECSIAAYTVTDNCRLCMGKACMNSCKFGAISMGPHRSYIDPDKCKECGQCAKACPYEAIVHLVRPCKKACDVNAITFDETGICKIDDSKCISCGHCRHACPFGAINSKHYTVNVIQELKAGKEVYAMVAPAIEGQYGPEISMGAIRQSFLKLGFADMVEVGLGGDMTAAYESAEWAEAAAKGKKMTTSCCPAFVNMLKKHFPEQYEENMSDVVSPMCAVSRYLKAKHPGCITVFVGPCIAKKSEALDKSVEGNADYVLAFSEFERMLSSRDMKIEPIEESEENRYQEASVFGKEFASSGGVADSVIECMIERGDDISGIRLRKCSGASECKTALLMLKAGKLPEDFIEGMACVGGCVGGPSTRLDKMETTRYRKTMFQNADDRGVLENLKDYPMESFSMFRDNH
ncbi:MAG: 4Fe-4S dicluster domain-containing protein [Lachnospiraceae bacterium]|nr:4Fe-4S dicluster domain-containing protein [Lachnospiraceae bacterium]